MRSTILGVIAISVLLALYLVFAGYRALVMLGSGEALGVVMGLALLVLPVIGLWALIRELRFGFASAALLKSQDSRLQSCRSAALPRIRLLPLPTRTSAR